MGIFSHGRSNGREFLRDFVLKNLDKYKLILYSLIMKKYPTIYRLKVTNGPDLTFGAPNVEVAKFYAEMCGFNVVSVEIEKV